MAGPSITSLRSRTSSHWASAKMSDFSELRATFRGFRRRFVLRLLARTAQTRHVSSGSKLIVAAHPDDETFGTGGLIAASRSIASEEPNAKQQVNIIFLTSGDDSHRDCCDISRVELGAKREATAKRVSRLLGLQEQDLHFMREPDGHLPHPGESGFERISLRLAELISEIAPEQIFTHHPLDGRSDHLAAEELTRAALNQSKLETTLFHYCVWFWFSIPLQKALSADWRQAILLNISAVHGTKKQAIQTYLQDLAPCGNPYCGILPHGFTRAFRWKNELFFRVPHNRW